MEQVATMKSHRMLFLNTLAFTVCFAAWMLNGVLVTFLVDNQVFNWGPIRIGWLMGIPVLTGALFRLPAGLLTDRYGGKPIFVLLLLLCALPLFLLSFTNSFFLFALCSFGFGLAGASFAIGIAYTSVWYPKNRQGTALGIFGAGNAGAAITTFFAPSVLNWLTDNGTNIEGWRKLPMIYGAIMIAMGIIFLVFAENKKTTAQNKTTKQLLSPLKNIRVWRFGLYYFLVFGCFVAFSQWLVPYFVNVYYMPLVTAGIFAALFSLPSGLFRAVGGWLSDIYGARKIMYWVLGVSVVVSFLLFIPKMEITSPGQGIMARNDGTVTFVSDNLIKVGNDEYPLQVRDMELENTDSKIIVFPTKEIWQEPVVKVGEKVERKQLLGKGFTKIFFQANVWIFVGLVILIGSVWGIGMAAVYKHIPNYFPKEVGVVGGMVGVIGGLGGFFCPILFGYLLKGTGLWTSCWLFMFFLSALCLIWMNNVITKINRRSSPETALNIEIKTN